MRRGTPKEILRFINRRRDLTIAELEARIRQDAEKLATVATDERFTFFWRQLTNLLRNKGVLLPGDGKGGFLPKTISPRLETNDTKEPENDDQLRPTPRKPRSP